MKASFLRKLAYCGIIIFSINQTTPVQAQDSLNIKLSADIVNSYIWRGYKQAGTSIQPSLSANYKNFSVGGWASTDINGDNKKEVDFIAQYETKGYKLAVTNYWCDGEEKRRYFSNPHNGSNGHYLEASAAFVFSESLPLNVTWNTFLLGKGNKKANGKNSYSTFVELEYPFTVKNVGMGISAGFTPWESSVYGTDGFKFTSIAVSASKNIKITDSYSLPVFGNIICNPNLEDIHFVFGFTLQ